MADEDRRPCTHCRQCSFGYHCSECTAAWRKRAALRSVIQSKTKQRKKRKKGQ